MDHPSFTRSSIRDETDQEERLETDQLKVAQAKVKKKAGEQAREFKRKAAEVAAFVRSLGR